MSWSTNSRERAKLGRLDSEPPLLLREWPPETGQRDKGEGKVTRRIRASGEEKPRSGSHNKPSQQLERERERSRGQETKEGERHGRIYPFKSTGFQTF